MIALKDKILTRTEIYKLIKKETSDDVRIIQNEANTKIIAIDEKTLKVGIARLNNKDESISPFGRRLAVSRLFSEKLAKRVISNHYGVELKDVCGNPIEKDIPYMNLKTGTINVFSLDKYDNVLISCVGKIGKEKSKEQNRIKITSNLAEYKKDFTYNMYIELFKPNNSTFVKVDEQLRTLMIKERLIVRS